ncbi:MAG: efflux RND transporter periplasmic adaptor subunit [Anaeromyxobacteraceae bacterium]|nr:efflux RND transporter periplasmic adaptor subunit [Anaeromyxobacteraceae bacterium]
MTEGHHTPPDHGPDAMPEGEEQAPPGTRTMAVVRWALVGLMALAAVAAWVDHAWTARSQQQAAGAQYICPMHPQIVTTHKGECPICGMDLVPAAAGEGAAAPAVAAVASYTCPMHPAFVTTDPKARCPDCGMKLTPVPAGAPAAPAGPPVPGLAPVELSADRVQLIGMRSAPATRETLASTIRAVGFVAANESSLVSVNTRFSGWVEQLNVGQTGQLVQKGEVLASLYSPEMLNAQQVFLNAIKWTERKPGGSATSPGIANDLERDARLRLELLGVASQDVDAIAEAGVPQRAINVRSPVRGYVARKSVLKGLYVQSGTELFQLADLSTVWVLVDVYEAEIPRVKVGQQATFELKAYPGKRFVGRVQFIYPALNTGSRTLQARVELRNPGLELRPGMFGDVTLDLGAAEAVVVPLEALIDTGDHRYVFVDRGGGRYEPRAVQAGWSGDGKVAILSGLAEGERVVTTANFLLDSESRLRAAVEGFSAAPAEHAAPPAAQAAHAHPPAAGAAAYTCPMHPEFVAADPKARCPTCGMKLVPKPPGAATPPHGGQPMPGAAATRGTAPMTGSAAMPGVPQGEAPMPGMPHDPPPAAAPKP